MVVLAVLSDSYKIGMDVTLHKMTHLRMVMACGMRELVSSMQLT